MEIKSVEEQMKEYQILLDYVEYLLANFKYEFEKGYGIPVLQGQADFYRKMLDKE